MKELIPLKNDLEKPDVNEACLGKVLDICSTFPEVDFRGIINTLCQSINIAGVLDKVQKGVEYVVQIPVELQKGFDAGAYWIMENGKTGMQWPMLMEKGADGKKRIVMPLPVKKQAVIQGNPIRQITEHYHNVYMQQQLSELSGLIETTLDTVKRIEQGQMDDRIGLLNAGRQGVVLAISQKDDAGRASALQNAINNINIAQNQVLETFKRRVEEFQPIPKRPAMQFLNECIKTGYLDNKDDEYSNILEYYSLYLQATQMLAGVYAIMGDIDTAGMVYDMSIAQMENIDFSKLSTMEYAHKGRTFEKIYESAVPCLQAEKQIGLEEAKQYECLTISLSGEKLLEAITDGEI